MKSLNLQFAKTIRLTNENKGVVLFIFLFLFFIVAVVGMFVMNKHLSRIANSVSEIDSELYRIDRNLQHNGVWEKYPTSIGESLYSINEEMESYLSEISESLKEITWWSMPEEDRSWQRYKKAIEDESFKEIVSKIKLTNETKKTQTNDLNNGRIQKGKNEFVPTEEDWKKSPAAMAVLFPEEAKKRRETDPEWIRRQKEIKEQQDSLRRLSK